MDERWLQAAQEQHRRQREQRERAVKAHAADEAQARANLPRVWAEKDEEIQEAAIQLAAFLSSRQGKAAMDLLTATSEQRSHFVFGEDRDGGGFAVIYYLDGTGLRRSYEPSGSWTIYLGKPPAPQISCISAADAVLAAANRKRIAPEKLMEEVRRHLNLIADRILPQNEEEEEIPSPS